MFKKIHWGWGVTLFYTGFVVFMLSLVYKSTLYKTDLVTADYYAKELKFQDQLDKMKRANSLKHPLNWKVEKQQVTLSFPQEMKGKNVKADILFYRPNNSNRDFTVTCHPDSTGNCLVASDKFQRGVYKMEIDWSAGNETYYNEGTININ